MAGTVDEEFPENPGSAAAFDYPVTRGEAREALREFVEHLLAGFGAHQDAMATAAPTSTTRASRALSTSTSFVPERQAQDHEPLDVVSVGVVEDLGNAEGNPVAGRGARVGARSSRFVSYPSRSSTALA